MNTENPTVTLRALDSSRGVAWLIDGWNVFKRNPGVWVLITLHIIVLNILIGMLPMVGLLTTLFVPVIAGGLLLACMRVDDGGEIEVGMLFDGFRSPAFSKLVMLGV